MNLCTHYRMISALHMLMLFLHWLGTNNSALSWCNIILLIPDHLMIGHTFNIFIPNTLLGNSTKIQKIQKLAAASLQEDEGSCGRRKHWLGKFQQRIVVLMTWKNKIRKPKWNIYVTSFSSISHWSNSEYWTQKCTQSGNIQYKSPKLELGPPYP